MLHKHQNPPKKHYIPEGTEEKPSEQETKDLPKCVYPPFSHVRLVELGL